MKNFAKGILAIFMMQAFVSCCKKEDAIIKPTEKKTLARVNTQGIVYLPLNIVLTGNPKKVFQNTWSQNLDLDQDTLNDLQFSLWIANDRYGNFYNIGTSVSTLQPGGGILADFYPAAFSGMANVWNARPLAAGTLIGPNSTGFENPVWTSTYSYSYYFGARRGGQIIGKGDKWIGFRFVSKSNTYFGWLKVNVSSNSQTFTIKGAAFMNQPDAPIAAGAIQ